MFANKTILVTGGTGSFGNAFIKSLLKDNKIKKIIIFSRDEKKQHDMMIDYRNNKLEFIIGDVRDRTRVFEAMANVDYVFHAAALKHVPTGEFFPLELVKTNILGSENVLDAAEFHNVKKVVVLSTDKAVYPINTMGMTKAVMEKLMIAKARITKSSTIFCGVRYGNVMASRGSVIPLIIKQIKENRQITITNPDMTRFLLPLPNAVELVKFAIEKGSNEDIFVKKSPASTVIDLAEVCLEIFNAKNKIKIIGIREGEKMHETLISQEELLKAEEFEDYYRIATSKEFDYDKYFTEGFVNNMPNEGYTSANTKRLNKKEIKKLLLSLDEIQNELKS